MIKTKYVDLYKKKGYHDGVFYVDKCKYKVKAFDSKDVGYFDDEFEIEVYLYEFYKGRYKIIRIENWCEYTQKVEDAVNYIIDKAYVRGEIMREFDECKCPEELKIELKNGVYVVTKCSIIKAREFLTMDDKNNFKDSEKFELMKNKTLSGKYDSRPSMKYVTLKYEYPELLKDVSFTDFCNNYYIENK